MDSFKPFKVMNTTDIFPAKYIQNVIAGLDYCDPWLMVMVIHWLTPRLLYFPLLNLLSLEILVLVKPFETTITQ